ncbi:MAG TPA: UDP-N-acetylmuramate:L-alanyl-gamma-D-glutamyl-meso-diaminopimelate ligase [Candidatus Binatia bacterium]
MNELPAKGSHIHLIAVCGVGMASLAGLLKARGYRVTGSDQNVYPPMSTYLAQAGIDVQIGFDPQHLASRPDLVIIGNAVSRDNPEAEAVLDGKIPYLSFPQALGRFLIGTRQSIVVAGTHGKTTTTALTAWVLKCAGLDPGFFIGGVPLNFGSGWAPGESDHVVLEGDEYDSAFFDKGPKFLHYSPQSIILTSVEFDHADIYRDLDHLKEAFRSLTRLIPTSGLLVACYDYLAVRDVVKAGSCRVISYGDNETCDWTVRNVRSEGRRSYFDPCFRNACEGAVELGAIGRHNVNNALGVYVLARELGIERSNLIEGFASFSGVKRRQEFKGEKRGILVIDDFAHHPTAVAETIKAVKDAFTGRRLWAIFEPRSNTSRRNIFEREFALALSLADRVVVSGLHQPEKIPEAERLSVQRVVESINQSNGHEQAVVINGADNIAAHVTARASPGDIILVMSNGAFDGVQDKILLGLAS